jgi:SET domain-containing protein
MSSKEYTPLPKCLTIKKSPIHGLGLFATEKIEEGTDLGKSHYATENEFIRTPLGGFVNHSDNPNVKMKRIKNTRYFHAIAIKTIKPGEELIGKYMMNKKTENVI